MNVATTTAGLTDLKFRLAREDFADAVAWVARNLPSRPTVPVLAGVLLALLVAFAPDIVGAQMADEAIVTADSLPPLGPKANAIA
mgnify:CR=1 FL=1